MLDNLLINIGFCSRNRGLDLEVDDLAILYYIGVKSDYISEPDAFIDASGTRWFRLSHYDIRKELPLLQNGGMSIGDSLRRLVDAKLLEESDEHKGFYRYGCRYEEYKKFTN